MTSIWSLLRTFRTGQKVAAGGNEIKGVVVRQGLNKKTVTVRAWWKSYNSKYNIYKKRASQYQAHDEENFCRIGDIVVIKACRKMTPTKRYIVRNVETQAARFDHWDNLDPSVNELISEKFYRLEGKQGPADKFRLQAMKESLLRIKSAGLFDAEASK